MSRGYSYVTRQERLSKASELKSDTEIELHLSDGTAKAKVTEIEQGGQKMTEKPTFEENLKSLGRDCDQFRKGDVPLEKALNNLSGALS